MILLSYLNHSYSTALLSFLCFTGEDCNSSFKGQAKVGPLQKMEKARKFENVYAKLGLDWNIDEQTMKDLGQIICHM